MAMVFSESVLNRLSGVIVSVLA